MDTEGNENEEVKVEKLKVHTVIDLADMSIRIVFNLIGTEWTLLQEDAERLAHTILGSIEVSQRRSKSAQDIITARGLTGYDAARKILDELILAEELLVEPGKTNREISSWTS